MKKLLVLAAVVSACQPGNPPVQTAAVPLAAAAAPAKPVAATKALALPDSLTPAMRTMLQQINLAELLATSTKGPDAGYQPVLDGFFGTNPQRLSLAILQATRDSLQPGKFWVVGKARFKQQISRFEGSIQLAKMTDYYEQSLLLSQGGDELTYVPDSTNAAGGYIANARAYSATAAFTFTSPAPTACSLTGRALLDFWVTDKGEVGFMHSPGMGEVLKKAPTKGSGLVLKGNWQDVSTRTTKPFLVSQNIFLLSPGLISDFAMGERNARINAKYAKLGWADYWKNDEWWADSPKPKLSL